MGAAGLAGCRLRLPPRRGGRTASVPRAGSRRVFAFQFNVPRGARVDRTRPARPRGHPRLLPTATSSDPPPRPRRARVAAVGAPRPTGMPTGGARVRSALPKGVSVTYPCYRYLRVYLREPRDSSTWILVRAPRPRYRCDLSIRAPRAGPARHRVYTTSASPSAERCENFCWITRRKHRRPHSRMLNMYM